MTDEKGPTVSFITVDTSARSLRQFAPNAQPEILDPIVLSPDLRGTRGRAWLCDTDKLRRAYGVKKENDACLAHWIIEAPWAHPIWHSYSLVVIHLRPLPGVADPLLYKEDATHEMWLYACNHEAKRLPTILGAQITRHFWLTPKNFGAQFIEHSDETALERIKSTVQMICDGKLSPDTDYLNDWGRLFGFNMLKDDFK